MGPMVLSLLGAVGSVFNGFFMWKAAKSSIITQGLQTVGQVAEADAETSMAQALPIVAEASSGSWLAANWRPLAMVNFLLLIDFHWFGYSPPNMSPTELTLVYGMMQIGLTGYVAGRTIEKVVDKLNLNRILGATLGKAYNKVKDADSSEGD